MTAELSDGEGVLWFDDDTPNDYEPEVAPPTEVAAYRLDDDDTGAAWVITFSASADE